MAGRRYDPRMKPADLWRNLELDLDELRVLVRRASARGMVKTATKDLADASADQDITGFGFDPKSGLILAGVNGGTAMAIGMFDATAQASVGDREAVSAGTYTVATGSALRLEPASGAHQVGVVSLITNGIRIAWTKTGAPTGTAIIAVHAFP